MSINIEEVEKLANLAKLKLSQEKIQKYANDLSQIVDYAESLNEVNVDGIEPTAHILKLQNVFRKDEIKPGLTREQVLQNAPTTDSGCIVVPKVVE